MDMRWNWRCAIFLLSSFLPHSDSACTLPGVFSGAWWDSNRGMLTFGSENISGLSLQIYNFDLQDWGCWQVDGFQGQNDGGTIIIKARKDISAFGINFSAYLCLNLTRISPYSFYYYQMYDRQNNANNERVFVTDKHEDELTKDDICKKQSDSGFDAEFKHLLKEGREFEARQDLPVQLLGNFEYTFFNTSGSYCDSPSGRLENCGDKKTMVFDYTKCSKEIAYSTTGNLSCVATIQKASLTYVMMYNHEPAEPSYRFTCFVVSSDGTSASYVYKNCSSNQSPKTFAVTSDGNPIGGMLTMKINDTCYNSSYKSAWTTKGQTTRPVNNPTTATKTVPSSPPKVTQTPPPTAQLSSSAAPPVSSIKSPDRQENPDTATLSTEGGISTGAVVAIGVTIGILAAIVITVVITYLLVKRRSPRIKRKVLSFINFSK